jgi:hypothetical protein
VGASLGRSAMAHEGTAPGLGMASHHGRPLGRGYVPVRREVRERAADAEHPGSGDKPALCNAVSL